jgi:hypothetical protein
MEEHTTEPGHNHEGHFSWLHEHTQEVAGGIVIALLGLLGIWLKVRKKHA